MIKQPLKIRFCTNQIGTAVEYWQEGDWRCLNLYRGILDTGEIRRRFAEIAARKGIKWAEEKAETRG